MKNPFLSKAANGYWYIYFYLERKRIKKTTGTRNKVTAIRFFQDFIDNKKYLNKSILLSEFYRIFKDTSSSSRNDGTISNYRATVNAFLKLNQDKYLDEYSVFEFDRFFNIRKNMKSVHTASRDKRCFNAMFNQALKYKYLEKNIIPETCKIKIPESDISFFTHDQFHHLLDVVTVPLYKDIFIFAVLSGLRMNELLNLKISHIDLEKNIINVFSNPEHRTKTGSSRQVDLNKTLIPIVNKYKSDSLLFTGNRDEVKINTGYLSRTTKKYCKLAGLPEHNFKAFRSTFGMWLLKEGVNLKYISQQLGHKSITTTEKHYAKYIPRESTGWINKINIY